MPAAAGLVGRDRLAVFHLERGTLAVFVLFGSLFHRRLGIPHEGVYQALLWLASVVLLVQLIAWRVSVPPISWRWATRGLGLALVSLIPLTLLISLWSAWVVEQYSGPTLNLGLTGLRELIYNLTYVAPMEVVIFRGFLWGYLVLYGWPLKRVLVLQGVLFWLLHFPRDPVTFFLIIPLITLLFSALVLNSRQLLPAILAHAVLNVLILLVVYGLYF